MMSHTYKFPNGCHSETTPSRSGNSRGQATFLEPSEDKQTRHYDIEWLNHHPSLSKLRRKGLSRSKMKWWAIYINIPVDVIVTLPHPQSGDRQSQETFWAPSADKESRNYDIESSNQHPSLSTLRPNGLSHSKLESWATHTIIPVDVIVRLPHPLSGDSQAQETFLALSTYKKTPNYDTECSNHHPSLSTLRPKCLSQSKMKWWAIHTNLQLDVIVKLPHPRSGHTQNKETSLAHSVDKPIRNYDIECSNHHPFLSTLRPNGLSRSKIKCWAMYTNFPMDAIVRLPHPRSANSQGQETFLEPSADKETRNYDRECSNHHQSLSTLRPNGLSHSKMKWWAIHTNLQLDVIVKLPHPRSGHTQNKETSLAHSVDKPIRNYDIECSNHHPFLSTLRPNGLSRSKIKCWAMYTNFPMDAIVRLPHPRSANSQGQETFLEPSADKETRNYDRECSNHHQSLSTLRPNGLSHSKMKWWDIHTNLPVDVIIRLPHPRGGDRRNQETSLAPSADMPTCNYNIECSNHHPSLSTLMAKGLSRSKRKWRAIHTNIQVDVIVRLPHSRSGGSQNEGTFLAPSPDKQTRNFDIKRSNYHPSLSSLMPKGLRRSKMKWWAIYTNIPVDAIARIPHPRSGDSQGQETFLAPSADMQTRHYAIERSNHHPSLSSLKRLSRRKMKWWAVHTNLPVDVKIRLPHPRSGIVKTTKRFSHPLVTSKPASLTKSAPTAMPPYQP